MRQALVGLAVAGAALLVATTAEAGGLPSPGKVTSSTCAKYASLNPIEFNKVFGSDSACQSALHDPAQGAIADCAKGGLVPGEVAFSNCIQSGVSVALSAIKANGLGVDIAAKSVLETSCSVSQDAAPSGFKRRFGTYGRCVSVLLDDAKAAVRSCGDPRFRESQSCFKTKIQALVKNYNR